MLLLTYAFQVLLLFVAYAYGQNSTQNPVCPDCPRNLTLANRYSSGNSTYNLVRTCAASTDKSRCVYAPLQLILSEVFKCEYNDQGVLTSSDEHLGLCPKTVTISEKAIGDPCANKC
ncbi:hypothetical protein M405DRAFT_815632 [Rhizopogon salebrosus TDB-379]|nr:hypothetical protein M405DRAFT_815632 [Rhizopogon salebrosus TDB-379]